MSTIKNTSALDVCPFILAVDNREKTPYTFQNVPPARDNGGRPVVVQTESICLPSGDYSIYGYVQEVAIERKTLQDLYSTIGQHRDRFEREFARLNSYGYAAIVVEASISDVLRPGRCREDWRSQLNPRSVYGTWQSWSMRYCVNWIFAENRRLAEIVTFHLLQRFWSKEQKRLSDRIRTAGIDGAPNLSQLRDVADASENTPRF